MTDLKDRIKPMDLKDIGKSLRKLAKPELDSLRRAFMSREEKKASYDNIKKQPTDNVYGTATVEQHNAIFGANAFTKTRGHSITETELETKEFVKYSTSTPDYKYNETKYLDELKKYIDATYDQHYAEGEFQATEFIIDGGHGTGFCIGNVLKYAQRYKKKGDSKEWRKDLMKILHYTIIQLHVHDKENS